MALSNVDHPLAKQFKQWWFSLLILSLIIGLSELPESIKGALELRHAPTDNGEWWRLYTSQIIHLGFNHSVLNFIGYLFLAFSFREEVSPSREICILLVSATGVGLGIYYLNPEMYSYVGLSGAIYGILIAYVIIGIHKTPGLSLFFMGFIILKFTADHLSGGSPKDTEAFIGGRVAFESHFYGAFTGILPGIYFFLKDKQKLLTTDTQTFVNQFKTPVVRDLAWALHSAPLLDIKSDEFDCVSNEQSQKYALNFLPSLKDLDQDPTPLLQAIDERKYRLGSYFEQLIKFWLEQNDQFELIAHGATVKQNKQTIGEFDFLLKDKKTNEGQHWEVAIKFYLATTGANEARNFYGPGKKDRLDIKAKHLSEKQILLSETKEGIETIKAYGLSVQKKVIFVKGRLFYPSKSLLRKPALMGILNKDHIRHCWYTIKVFCDQQPLINTLASHALAMRYRIADKPEWMTLNSDKSMNYKELAWKLKAEPMERPYLIICTRRNKEISRFFIVPNDWEEQLT